MWDTIESNYEIRKENGSIIRLYDLLRYSGDLLNMPALLMREQELEHRRLRIFLKAQSIITQLPGSHAFESEALLHDLEEMLNDCRRNELFNVFDRCVNQLVARQRALRTSDLTGSAARYGWKLIEQIPGGESYRLVCLPESLRKRIDQLENNAILNVAANCLDELMIKPAIEAEKKEIVVDVPRKRRRRRGRRR